MRLVPFSMRSHALRTANWCVYARSPVAGRFLRV
jgi:hypothetical protein